MKSFGFVFCLSLVIGGPALAQEAAGTRAGMQVASATISASINPDDPIAFYRAFETAIEAGDLVSAQTAAFTAWRTGERVWNGANPNLPGLAFNAAWTLGLVGKIKEAEEPARRAIALGEAYPGKVDAQEVNFLLAYSQMQNDPSQRNIDGYFRTAKVVDNGRWADLILARSYADGAIAALNRRKPELAREMIDRGLAEVGRIAPNNDNLKINLYVLRNQSSLQSQEYARAVSEMMEARRAYGPPKSARDVFWATLFTWEYASRAYHLSVYGESRQPRELRTGNQTASKTTLPVWNDDEAMRLGRFDDGCPKADFRRRGTSGYTGINFPLNDLNEGYPGGTYIMATLDAQGNVIDTDILASLPRPSFGAAAAAGIRGWQYTVPTGTPPQCLKIPVLVNFAFRG